MLKLQPRMIFSPILGVRNQLRAQNVRHRCCAEVDDDGDTRGSGFWGGVLKVGKKVQGGLPLVGLISRLSSPDGGGFDEQTYPEFARMWLEAGEEKLIFGFEDIQAISGTKGSGRRPILLLCWMIQTGSGYLQPEYFALTARRLRASMDIEAEMGRFQQTLDGEKLEYTLLERPLASLTDQVAMAVDCIATVSYGLRDGVDLQAGQQQQLMLDIVSTVFPEATEQMVQEAIDSRVSRKDAYVTAY